MQSMDSDLERLYRAGLVGAEEAYMKAANKKNFELVIAGPDAAKILADAKAAEASGNSAEADA